jgi:hypothetical protein
MESQASHRTWEELLLIVAGRVDTPSPSDATTLLSPEERIALLNALAERNRHQPVTVTSGAGMSTSRPSG